MFSLGDETGAKVDMFNRKEDKRWMSAGSASRYATSNYMNGSH